MKRCTKCHFENSDDNVFCLGCGEKLPLTMINGKNICRKCRFENPMENTFCESCGADLRITTDEKEKSKIGKMIDKTFIGKMGRAKYALLLIPILLLSFLAYKFLVPKDKLIKDIVYLKNDNLYLREFDGKDIAKLTDEMKDEDALANFTITSDKEKLLFVKKVNKDFQLNWMDLKDKEHKINTLGSILSYEVSKKSDKVFFISSLGDLYEYNFIDKNKIASGVKEITLNSNDNSIIYLTRDNELYAKLNEKEKVKIDSQVIKASYALDKNKVIYQKGADIYDSNLNEVGKNVAKGVENLIRVQKDGSFYYTKKSKDVLKATDFYIDDMAEKDKNINKPNEPRTPSSSSKTFEEDMKKYTEEVKKYETALKIFNEKQARETLRKALADPKNIINFSELYYNDGAETLIANNIKNMSDIVKLDNVLLNALSDKIFPVYKLKEGEMEKKKLTQLRLDKIDELFDSVTNSLQIHMVDTKLIEKTDFNGHAYLGVSKNSKKAMIIDMDSINPKEITYRVLTANINSGKLTEMIEIASKLKTFPMIEMINNDESIVTYKEGNKIIAQVNDKQISDDLINSYKIYKDKLYFIDGVNKKELKEFNKGNIKTLDEDVTSAVISFDKIFYIKDANDNKIGDLYILNKDKKERIETDVKGILSIEDSIMEDLKK